MLCLVSEVVRLVNNSVVIVTFAYKDEHLIKYLLICTLKPALYVYLFFPHGLQSMVFAELCLPSD